MSTNVPVLLAMGAATSAHSAPLQWPQAGAAKRAALGGAPDGLGDRPPMYITTNPLSGLPPLPKVHTVAEGIDPSYLNGPFHANFSREASHALLADFARITGAIPAMNDD